MNSYNLGWQQLSNTNVFDNDIGKDCIGMGCACDERVSASRPCLRTLYLFTKHLRAKDTRHERIPLEHFVPSNKQRRYPPRIFSIEEVERVLSLTSQLWPDNSIRPLTYRTLIGLLFSTGMRISGPLNLRLSDIHSDSLTIQHSKFGKSRWLSLHQSTIEALEHYLIQRRALAADVDPIDD